MDAINPTGAIPGLFSSFETITNDVLWDAGANYNAKFITGQVLSTATDAGATPTSLLRAGLIMGYVDASRAWVPWNPLASNGSQRARAVLATEVDMVSGGVAKQRLLGGLFIGGNIKASRLLIAGASNSYGLSGHIYEMLARRQLAHYFMFDDWNANVAEWGDFVNVAANRTLTLNDHGTTFIGHTGAVVLTLPAVASCAGFRVRGIAGGNVGMTFTSPTNDTIIANNDLNQNVGFATSGQIQGNGFEIEGIILNGSPIYLAKPLFAHTGTQTLTLS